MMDAFADAHFIRPAWLLLVPLALALWWWWQRGTDPLRGWREQIAPALLAALVVGHGAQRRRAAVWRLAAWLAAIVAIAGPTWRLEPSPFGDDATPLMILLKADTSMMQPDPAPSRMERARLKVADLAQARAGQPLGLIAYAGSAHMVLPPTRDTAIVARMANEVGPQIMPVPGDRLDLALREAVRVLGEGARGSIVVLTDSVATDLALLQALPRSSVPLQFLAINTPDSGEDDALRAAAGLLDASIEPFDADGTDVASIVRHAAHTPVAQRGEQSDQWQEAGYWLVPVLAVLVLLSFRRRQPAAPV
jgi:Ca-activated chloride channel homolog